MRSLFSREPHGVRRFRDRALGVQIGGYLATGHFDIVICDDVYVLGNLPADCPAPVLLNKHDLTYVIFERYARVVRNPLKRAYARIELAKVRRWEQMACSACDVVLGASSVDHTLISSMAPGTPVVIVPNALDLTAYSPCDQPPVAKADLLFFGAMDFYPNQDAVQFLVSEILPLIRKNIPGVRLLIAGRSMPEQLADQLKVLPGVSCMHDVPHMRDLIAESSVCLVPLRIGSGTRLKILEAAAMRKAVVSTGIGAEGLGFVDGKEILIADAPGPFASAVVSLMRDARRRESMGSAARDRVEREYSVPVLRRRLKEAIELACANSLRNSPVGAAASAALAS